jgi:DNA-binding NarL/FixJ family response regulator
MTEIATDVPRPVAVAAVNDYELVVKGLAAMLGSYSKRLRVVEHFLIGEPVENGPIDVALFDTYGRVGIAERALVTLTQEPQIRRVALFSLDFPKPLVSDARRLGITAFISKSLPGEELVAAIVDASRGVPVDKTGPRRSRSHPDRTWPGCEDRLSERESQVLVLCAEGLTNREIAEALYLSPETIKSHLARIYRRLDLANRTEAARYVQRSGAFARFQPAETALTGSGEIDQRPAKRRRAPEAT